MAVVNSQAKESNATQADIENWAHSFSAYLKESLTDAVAPSPNLAITVSISEQAEPITIVYNDGIVSVNEFGSDNLPTCSLVITDKSTVTALQVSDVQVLLRSICKGTCLLKGQVEPFIWFIGRIVDQKQVEMKVIS